MRCSIQSGNLYSPLASQILPIIQFVKNQINTSAVFWPELLFDLLTGLATEINYLVNVGLLLSPLSGGQPINLSKIETLIYEYHQKQNRIFIKQIT